MQKSFPCSARRYLRLYCCSFLFCAATGQALLAASDCAQAEQSAAFDGTVRSGPPQGGQIPVAGAKLYLQEFSSHTVTEMAANGEGVFRVFPMAPGDYSLRVESDGYAPFAMKQVTLHANEV